MPPMNGQRRSCRVGVMSRRRCLVLKTQWNNALTKVWDTTCSSACQPSLRDGNTIIMTVSPAMNRWATVKRPCGTKADSPYVSPQRVPVVQQHGGQARPLHGTARKSCAAELIPAPDPWPLLLQPILLDLPIQRPLADAQHLGRLLAVAAGSASVSATNEPLQSRPAACRPAPSSDAVERFAGPAPAGRPSSSGKSSTSSRPS